tara:strand:- start:2537 stop:2728 length:192 start_codon:yes stop_codon:yes gene_type:complete
MGIAKITKKIGHSIELLEFKIDPREVIGTIINEIPMSIRSVIASNTLSSVIVAIPDAGLIFSL